MKLLVVAKTEPPAPPAPCRTGSHRYWYSGPAGCGASVVLVERPTRHRGDWWFAEATRDEASKALTERAKQLCRVCPERMACYETAVTNREQHGVWGGVEFPHEYRALMRIKTRTAAGGLVARAGPRAAGAVPEVRSA